MKTIKEAATDYANSREDNDYTIETEMAFCAGAELVQRWIPASEPPESDEILTPVIVKLEGKSLIAFIGYEIMNYDRRDKKFHYRFGLNHNARVTHWRPIEYK